MAVSMTAIFYYAGAWVLFYFPDVIGFKKFCKVVILLGGLNLFYLSGYCIVIGGSLNVADNAQCNGESIAVTH